MSKIAKSFVELIGKTPLLATTRFGKNMVQTLIFSQNWNTSTQAVP